MDIRSFRNLLELFFTFQNILNSEFQLFRTNGSRVIENGHGSTFEVCHPLLSHRSTNLITYLTY